jgi:hypothetical protein
MSWAELSVSCNSDDRLVEVYVETIMTVVVTMTKTMITKVSRLSGKKTPVIYIYICVCVCVCVCL